MPVRLLDKIARSSCLMKVAFEFNPPNAIIDNGIFLAKSLQASATLRKLFFHEFQHLVFCTFKSFTGDALRL